MAKSFVVAQSADPDAGENIGFLHGYENQSDYVETGLDVSVDYTQSPPTVSATEGKASVLVPEATAEWSNNAGDEFSELRKLVAYSVWYNATQDTKTPHTLAATDETNTVYLVLNLAEDDMPYLDVRAISASPPTAAGTLEIAEIDPADQTVTLLNPGPDAFFESVEASEITDGASVSHTGELADLADVRTDEEIRDVIADDPDHGDLPSHDYLSPTHYNETYDADRSGVVDDAETAQHVSGGDVDGAVANAAHADQATDSTLAGGIDPAAFLRTDVEDKMGVPLNMNDYGLQNVHNITVSANSGAALDLTPNSDGSHVVVKHDDPADGTDGEWWWQSAPGWGEPMRVKLHQPGGEDRNLLSLNRGGNLSLPEGDVFSEEGRLASQRWTNDNFFQISGGRVKGDVDLTRHDLAGVDAISFADSSGVALDLTPNSDGNHILWQHDDGTANPREFSAQLDAGNGIPWKLRDSARGRNLMEVHDNGYIALPYGGLALDGPVWMGTHNHFGDDTTHDIIFKQDSNGREGHIHMHDDVVEIFPDGEPDRRSFGTDVITGETGIGGDLNVDGDVSIDPGSGRIYGPRFVEYVSSGGRPAPPNRVGFRLYYYNNAIWAINDAGDDEKVHSFS